MKNALTRLKKLFIVDDGNKKEHQISIFGKLVDKWLTLKILTKQKALLLGVFAKIFLIVYHPIYFLKQCRTPRIPKNYALNSSQTPEFISAIYIIQTTYFFVNFQFANSHAWKPSLLCVAQKMYHISRMTVGPYYSLLTLACKYSKCLSILIFSHVSLHSYHSLSLPFVFNHPFFDVVAFNKTPCFQTVGIIFSFALCKYQAWLAFYSRDIDNVRRRSYGKMICKNGLKGRFAFHHLSSSFFFSRHPMDGFITLI